MNNLITTYTSMKLVEYSDFVNTFLDSLLDNYCEQSYKEGFCYKTLPKITVDTLITKAYPEYYKKHKGLYGHKFKTDVQLMYEDDLHEVLEEALAHKLSRLFIKISALTRTLYFSSFSSPPPYTTKNALGLVSKESILKSLQRRLFINNNNFTLEKNIGQLYQNLSSFFYYSDEEVYVYKPTSSNLADVIEKQKRENYNLFLEKTGIFDFENRRDKFNIIFSLSMMFGLTYDTLFTKEDYIKLQEQCNEISNSFIESFKTQAVNEETIHKNKKAKSLKDKEDQRKKIQEELEKHESEMYSRDVFYEDRPIRTIPVFPKYSHTPIEKEEEKGEYMNVKDLLFIIFIVINSMLILYLCSTPQG